MAFLEPEGGLVVSHSYLWSDEADAGHIEGRKNRPCAIVLVVLHPEGRAPLVTVAPITHSAPRNPDVAVEIPPAVKRHLGLDSEASWDVLDDFNVFTWPGLDLRPVPGQKNRYDYGFLPPKFFGRLVRKFSELRRQRRAALTARDET